MIRKPRTEKNFAADSESALTAVASLNRIFKKVESDGLSEEATQELAEDIQMVSERFGICPKAAVLLSAIMEKTNSSNSCDEDAGALASEFKLSGGNIDNVARKSVVDYVLTGSQDDVETIRKYCGEESVSKKKEVRRIGF